MAVDVQGAPAVAPWVKQSGVTFPVAVDASDVLGATFGLKAIPVSFLIDESGVIRLRGGGPSGAFLAQVEAVLREPISPIRAGGRPSPASLSSAALRGLAAAAPTNGALHLALAQALEREDDCAGALEACATAAGLIPQDAMVPFTHGLALLRLGRTNEALVKLEQARALDAGNWRIRKQIWALRSPGKFYGPNGIDWNWQKAQRAREEKEE